MKKSGCLQGLMDSRTAKNSLGSVTFSAKYTFLVDIVRNTGSSNCGKILWSFTVIFGVFVCWGDWLAFLYDFFFSGSKVERDVVSSALKLLLEMSSMDADLSHGSFVMEACKPVKFNWPKWVHITGFFKSVWTLVSEYIMSLFCMEIRLKT